MNQHSEIICAFSTQELGSKLETSSLPWMSFFGDEHFKSVTDLVLLLML